MARLPLPIALAALVLLAGCVALDSTAGTTPVAADTASPVGPDEPTLDLVSDPSNLGQDERPHDVRIETERASTVNVTLGIVRDGYDTSRTVRLSPNTTVLGTLDYEANYTLTVTAGEASATETLPASTFDCNSSGTTFTVTDDGVTVRTMSTMLACQ